MRTPAWKESLFAVPGVGVSLLPKLACPLCWPAYAGILSTLGLGFLISTVYLMPLTVVVLSLAVGSLAFRASQRRGLGPFFWLGSREPSFYQQVLFRVALRYICGCRRTGARLVLECGARSG
jgi:hypothetical protein